MSDHVRSMFFCFWSVHEKAQRWWDVVVVPPCGPSDHQNSFYLFWWAISLLFSFSRHNHVVFPLQISGFNLWLSWKNPSHQDIETEYQYIRRFAWHSVEWNNSFLTMMDIKFLNKWTIWWFRAPNCLVVASYMIWEKNNTFFLALRACLINTFVCHRHPLRALQEQKEAEEARQIEQRGTRYPNCGL